jgi:predicted transcriptional regulator
MKRLVIGILPQDKIRRRALAIAKGEYVPQPGEPKIWFASMRSVAEVLSDRNRSLLKAIADTHPSSVAALAQTTGRQPGNLSRTLNTLSKYGLVELRRRGKTVQPIAKAVDFEIRALA